MDFSDSHDSKQDLQVNRDDKFKVFYNSACPVCNAGISSQQRKMAECPVEWLDIHTDLYARDSINTNVVLIRERLHIIDENGKLAVGMRAFEAIWRRSPNEIWKANIVSLPIIKPFSDLAYNVFARLLYKWNRWRGHW